MPEGCGTERLLCLRAVSAERLVILCLRAVAQRLAILCLRDVSVERRVIVCLKAAVQRHC